MNTRLFACSLMLLGGLAGCGGGGNGGGGGSVLPPVADSVPASATASPEAYVRYIGSLTNSESAQPLDVSHVVPPVTDSGAPIDLG